MFDSSLDRALAYRRAAAYDCWGDRRSLRRGTRNGIWFIDVTGFDEHVAATTRLDPDVRRKQLLQQFASSGKFTPVEIRTLHALLLERLTIGEVAAREGCTRQAVTARLIGNSRGQGGIVRKARILLATSGPEHIEE